MPDREDEIDASYRVWAFVDLMLEHIAEKTTDPYLKGNLKKIGLPPVLYYAVDHLASIRKQVRMHTWKQVMLAVDVFLTKSRGFLVSARNKATLPTDRAALSPQISRIDAYRGLFRLRLMSLRVSPRDQTQSKQLVDRLWVIFANYETKLGLETMKSELRKQEKFNRRLGVNVPLYHR